MAYLRLIREKPNGNAKNAAVRGRLYLVTYNLLEEREEEHLICPTLENRDYLIPPLIYPLTVTYSPKFQRPLPLVGQVPSSLPAAATESAGQIKERDGSSSPHHSGAASGAPYRTGIRFHPGSMPEHSRGCILLKDRATEDRLRELIQSEREVRLEINETLRGSYENEN